MAKQLNGIPRRQNQEAALRLLRARTDTYSSAMFMLWIQLVLTALIPTLGAILSSIAPEYRVHVASVSLLVAVIDPLFLDRRYKSLLKVAAKLGEQFDCSVLEIPWDQFAVGSRVDAEDVHAASARYSKRNDDQLLRNWYPKNVGNVPIHYARIICQRINLRYDGRLRRSYGAVIIAFAIIVVGGLFLSAYAQNLALRDWILSMTPAVPVIGWAAREYYRQSDTADALDGLKKLAESLWEDARTGNCDADGCLLRSREFQGAIYNRRANSPLVLPFIYAAMRTRLEHEMEQGTAELVASILPRNEVKRKKA